MIELPEVLVLSSQLRTSFSGKRIASAQANHSPHAFAFYTGDPGNYGHMLSGKVFVSASAHGGRILVDLSEDMCLEFFDGANLRLLAPGAARPEKHQLLIEFDDGSALYATVSMYGGLFAYPRGMMDDNFYSTVAAQKPSPLSDAFDEPYFLRLFEGIKPSLSMKALLATEQRIPGLGNGVLQDILWNARLHPKHKALSLSPQQRHALFETVKTTLKRMHERGGRNTEKDLYGNPGGYASILSSKTVSLPCPACGGPITRQAYLGGNVYFCANCQGG